MSSAGQRLTAGRIPGERIGITEETSDSSNFTTSEVELISLTVPLVSGRTYSVSAKVGVASTVAADIVEVILREDNTSGTAIDATRVYLAEATTGGPFRGMLQSDYSAGSTANKTFVITGIRRAGSGSCRMEADSTRKSHLQVTYEEG